MFGRLLQVLPGPAQQAIGFSVGAVATAAVLYPLKRRGIVVAPVKKVPVAVFPAAVPEEAAVEAVPPTEGEPVLKRKPSLVDELSDEVRDILWFLAGPCRGVLESSSWEDDTIEGDCLEQMKIRFQKCASLALSEGPTSAAFKNCMKPIQAVLSMRLSFASSDVVASLAQSVAGEGECAGLLSKGELSPECITKLLSAITMLEDSVIVDNRLKEKVAALKAPCKKHAEAASASCAECFLRCRENLAALNACQNEHTDKLNLVEIMETCPCTREFREGPCGKQFVAALACERSGKNGMWLNEECHQLWSDVYQCNQEEEQTLSLDPDEMMASLDGEKPKEPEVAEAEPTEVESEVEVEPEAKAEEAEVEEEEEALELMSVIEPEEEVVTPEVAEVIKEEPVEEVEIVEPVVEKVEIVEEVEPVVEEVEVAEPVVEEVEAEPVVEEAEPIVEEVEIVEDVEPVIEEVEEVEPVVEATEPEADFVVVEKPLE